MTIGIAATNSERSGRCVEGVIHRLPREAVDTGSAVDALDLLDEHMLDKPVRFFDVGVVVALSDVSDFLKRPVANHFARLAKRLEGVFRLSCHQNVADKAKVVALACGVGESGHYDCAHSYGRIRNVRVIAQLRLVFLEHSMMPTHVGSMLRAEIAQARVVSSFFVIFERIE
jgi:hypothetical protein